MPIVDAVQEEFEQTYHHLLHCFLDVRSLVEPVARIEEIQRVMPILLKPYIESATALSDNCVPEWLAIESIIITSCQNGLSVIITACQNGSLECLRGPGQLKLDNSNFRMLRRQHSLFIHFVDAT